MAGGVQESLHLGDCQGLLFFGPHHGLGDFGQRRSGEFAFGNQPFEEDVQRDPVILDRLRAHRPGEVALSPAPARLFMPAPQVKKELFQLARITERVIAVLQKPQYFLQEHTPHFEGA